MAYQSLCIACGGIPTNSSSEHDVISVDCPVCGDYTCVDNTITADFRDRTRSDDVARKVLSHRIRQMTLAQKRPRIPDSLIRQVLEDPVLPTPAEQADNLVLFVGDRRSPGRAENLTLEQWVAIIGAENPKNARFIMQALPAFVNTTVGNTVHTAALTFEGWKKYYELRNAKSESRKAFMAMPFNDPVLDRLFYEYLMPAVDVTGFRLFRTDQEPRAGLIDDRMRVQILTSRFLVAELTYENCNVYWEAGFGEGWRKPVIYVCEKAVFDKRKTAFDTNHRHTVLWEEGRLDEVVRRIKDTIRSTLPDEARMEDPVVVAEPAP